MAKLYRYYNDTFISEGHNNVYLSEYEVKRETPKGYWINCYGDEKFVLKGDGKRYAHETKEMALNSFIRRKQRQILLTKRTLEVARYSIESAKFLNEQFKQGIMFKCDSCGDIKPVAEKFEVMNENFGLQEGLYECASCRGLK